jgi:hypothetical protein
MPDLLHERSVEIDEGLCRRICAEYRELPGLQLTVAQASRLWNTDISIARQALDALVDRACLHRDGSLYVRA